MKKETVGFIGTGVMGRSMAGNLISAGYPLNVYNRTAEKAKPLLEAGAKWKDNPSEIASASEVMITIVGFPEDVEEVYFGQRGILEGIKPGKAVIDMTTSSPKLAKRIYESAKEKEVYSLDAPVSGGDRGAREAALAIMAGGDEKAFRRLRPILESMGSNVVYQGPAGSGQHSKMANQIAIASCIIGVCESLAYAGKAGLEPLTVLKSIENGAAGSWTLSNLAPRILEGDFRPGFYIKHFIKDMKLAIESAEEMDLNLPGLELAKRLYGKLAAEGGENLGTQALFRLYNEG